MVVRRFGFFVWVAPPPHTHTALRSPFTPGLRLTPNQMYAALISLRGYRSTALSAQEIRKLLSAVWVRVSRKGFQINNRTYNLDRGKLDLFRGPSGITAQQGRWEVHYCPDRPDVTGLFNHLVVLGQVGMGVGMSRWQVGQAPVQSARSEVFQSGHWSGDRLVPRNGRGSRAVERGVRRLNSSVQEPRWSYILPYSTCLTPWSSG
ncbi:hypothetical protein ACLMNJ_36505 [Streptomyces seoulensis]